jgi:transposase
MAKQATPVELSAEDQRTLRTWIRDASESQSRAQRARIILLAAERRSTKQIARTLGVRAARVSKWRTRFAAAGLAGLEDVARPGKPRQYDELIDRRILSLVEESPPAGAAVWTGPLLAKTLGSVSLDHVWKVLRQNAVKLRPRDQLEIETQSPFRSRSVAVLGIYLSNSASAFLVGVCDGAAPGAARSFVRTPSPEVAAHLKLNARAERPSLLDALQWAVALAERGSYIGRSARSLDAFLSEARSFLPDGEIHVYVTGSLRQPHPDLHIFEIPTLSALKEHLRSWLVPFLKSAGPVNRETISQLVSLGERLVLAQTARLQAAFEWYARLPRTIPSLSSTHTSLVLQSIKKRV